MIMELRASFVFFITASLLCIPTFAARPFITDDIGINEPGKFEFMAACDFWRDRAMPCLQLRHGLTDRMDFGINVGYSFLPGHEKRFSTADINAKFAILPDAFAVAFTGMLGQGCYCAYGILEKSFGPIAFDANFGYSAHAETDEGDLFYYLSVIWESGRLGVGPEFGGTGGRLDRWTVGGRWRFTEWLTFDTGLQGDFEKPVGLIVTTGIDIVFPIKKNACTQVPISP